MSKFAYHPRQSKKEQKHRSPVDPLVGRPGHTHMLISWLMGFSIFLLFWDRLEEYDHFLAYGHWSFWFVGDCFEG